MSLATPSSPSSVGSREEFGGDEPSSPSWVGDALSGGEDSDGALSSEDDHGASFLSQAAPRPKIKLKRGHPALDAIETESHGESEAPSTSGTATPDLGPATGSKRKRPIKQLRAKPLRTALTSLLAAFKKYV